MSDTLRASNLHFGLNASNYNQPQIGFTSVGIGSTANYGFLQFFGTSNTLCWTANGTVGIGMTAPVATLDVTGSFRVLSTTYTALTSGTGVDIIYSGGGQLTSGTRGAAGVLTAATMSYAASTHTFYTGVSAGSTAITINSSGRVIHQYYGSTVFNGNPDGTGIVVYGGSGGSASSTSGDVISTGVLGYISYNNSGSYGNAVITQTKGQFFPSFNGIYTISWTTRMAGASEVIISKNRGNQNDYVNYGANPNYTPTPSLNGAGMLAHAAVINNNNNITLSWTGYLTTTDYICLGQYNGSATGYSVSTNVIRSSVTFTLIQSTA